MSFQGHLLNIFLTGKRAGVLNSLDAVEAVAGRGLVGDRYFLPLGKINPEQEITLIEIEALEGLAREYQITLQPHLARRNLLTQGVPLNHLVDREFLVGNVRLRGVKLCEPCGHLESLTRGGLKKGLSHRGGLRAQILQGGMVRVGDTLKLP